MVLPARSCAIVILTFSVVSRCAHSSNRGAFTVKLHRQQIPLHSTGGIVHHKSAYYGSIAVGGPTPQVFQVVFDTGSGHLVLPSSLCKSETCLHHQRYKRRSSDKARDIDVDGTQVAPGEARDQITVSFGTGEVTGVFVHDYVCLGATAPLPSEGFVANSLIQMNISKLHTSIVKADLHEDEPAVPDADHGCVELRLISAIAMSDDPFSSFAFDGVLGLGLNALSQTPEFNFMLQAATRGAWGSTDAVLSNTFAAFLATSDAEESEITFGGFDPKHIKKGQEFAWNTVQNVHDGYWQVDVLEIRANGVRIDYCDGPVPCRAIVDTGTSLLGVPSPLGPILVDRLRHVTADPAGACDGPGPQLEIVLETFTVVLDPVDYARPEFIAENDDAGVSQMPTGVSHASSKISGLADDDRSCVPMLMHIDLPEPLSPKTLLLGEPVLQRYYTAFDIETPRVGMAEAVHVAPKLPMVVGRTV